MVAGAEIPSYEYTDASSSNRIERLADYCNVLADGTQEDITFNEGFVIRTIKTGRGGVDFYVVKEGTPPEDTRRAATEILTIIFSKMVIFDVALLRPQRSDMPQEHVVLYSTDNPKMKHPDFTTVMDRYMTALSAAPTVAQSHTDSVPQLD